MYRPLFYFNKLSFEKTFICKVERLNVNSVDPDETSHLDLCCLQKFIIIACGSERVKVHDMFLCHISFM